MAKYNVTFKVEAICKVEIEADDIKSAKEEAEYQFSGVDFGVAEDIDGEIINVRDVDGNYLWEK